MLYNNDKITDNCSQIQINPHISLLYTQKSFFFLHFSKIVCMFAVLNIYKSPVRAELALIMRAFFMLVLKILRYIVPPCGTVMEPQHR